MWEPIQPSENLLPGSLWLSIERYHGVHLILNHNLIEFQKLVLSQDSSLNEDQLIEKASIGPKGCRAIKRLAVIPARQSCWHF